MNNDLKCNHKSSKLILASTSPFRREILAKLALPFDAIKPDCDETPKAGERPIELVERLAIGKAQSVASSLAATLATTQNQQHTYYVIGSDQVAVYQNKIIGKPHTRENAIKQLTDFSGQAITFYTGLCVYRAGVRSTKLLVDKPAADTSLAAGTREYLSLVEPFTVHFRDLSQAQIEYYIDQEQPLNCAGSFKSEGLGISLFKKLEGDDPNTLIGLPLIKLIDLLHQFGLDVLNHKN